VADTGTPVSIIEDSRKSTALSQIRPSTGSEPPGGGRAFPSTRWSRLAEEGAAERSRAALEELANRYWKPVYAYVRARWAKTDEDARDAVQDFFLWVAEGDLLARADPERGRFRAFVKTALANFLHDGERRRRTLKRGEARALVSMTGTDGTALELPATGASPEEALDEAWRKELLAGATDGLQTELEDQGKPLYFAVFHDFFLSDEELDYAAVAARHKITKVDVSNYLAHAKRLYRAHLRALLIETVQGDEDLRAELDWLFGSVGR
jgi:RNA polymerase sigma-70 factor (ECF subfamily)